MKVETAVKITLTVIVVLMIAFIFRITWINHCYQPPTVTQLPLPPQSDYNERLKVFAEQENSKILGDR